MQSDSPSYLKGALFGFAAVSIWAGWSAMTRLAVTTSLDAWDIPVIRFGVAGLDDRCESSARLKQDHLMMGMRAAICGPGTYSYITKEEPSRP